MHDELQDPELRMSECPVFMHAAAVPEQGLVLITLSDNPFTASLTTPHIFAARHHRGQDKHVLHTLLDRLLVQMFHGNFLDGAIVTGAEGGNTMLLNIPVPQSDAPEFTLYGELVDLINYLNAVSGVDESIDPIGRQFADLTDLYRGDRKQFNAARAQVYDNMRVALVAALNRALKAEGTLPPQPGTQPSSTSE